MSFNSHPDMRFPGFLDGGGTFDAQTTDWMFEESRMNPESDLLCGLPDTNAPAQAGPTNEENIRKIFIENFINRFPMNVNVNVNVNVKLAGGNVLDQGAPNEAAIRENTINKDTVNREAADAEIGSDFFHYNGKWHRYATDVSPEFETLAQDAWAGGVDLTTGSNQTTCAPCVAEKVQGDGTQSHLQAESQPIHIRRDTPIPDWDQDDKDKASSQAEDQTATDRTVTPTTEQEKPQLPSPRIRNVKRSKPVHRRIRHVVKTSDKWRLAKGNVNHSTC